eukprot:CCRYP_012069-RA/>CCRYP_012069-RA protein AED:0.05 eAED:0.05 QI:236/1/1/1/1/1/6/761/608
MHDGTPLTMLQHESIYESAMAAYLPSPLAVSDFHLLELHNSTTAFEPTPFVPSPIIERYHNVWRFGHSNNFTMLVDGIFVEGDGGEGRSYVDGVIAVSVFVLVVSIIWVCVIFAFKYAGPKRVGFLAGCLIEPDHTKQVSPRTSVEFLSVIQEEDEILDVDESESVLIADPMVDTPFIITDNIEEEMRRVELEKKFLRKVTTVRAVFLLSGVGVIISGGLFYGKGVKSLNNAFAEVRLGTSDLRGKTLEALNISNSILADQKELVKTVDTIQVKVPEISKQCSSIPRLGEIIQPIMDQVKGSTAEIKKYSGLLESSLVSANDSMDRIVLITEDVDTTVDTTQKYFVACVWTSSLFFVVILTMLVGSLLVIYEKSNRLTQLTTSVWLWPLFAILLILAWVFATLFLAASLSGSDLCVQPDEVTYSVLAANSEGLDSTIYMNLVNYITGCSLGPAAIVPDHVDVTSEIEKIHNASAKLQSVTRQLGSPLIQQVVGRCGLNETTVAEFQDGADQLHDFAHLLSYGYNSLENEIFSCSAMNPIYVMFVHDALCSDAVEGGVIWLFSTTVFVVMFSMMMVTFRSAMYPIKWCSTRANVVDFAEPVEGDAGVLG